MAKDDITAIQSLKLKPPQLNFLEIAFSNGTASNGLLFRIEPHQVGGKISYIKINLGKYNSDWDNRLSQ